MSIQTFVNNTQKESHMKRTLFCLITCFFSVFLTGCGDKEKPLKVEFVQGVVTFDGEPVVGASISFFPVVGGGSTETAGGFSNASGVYRLTSMNGTPEKGAVAGEYLIVVEKYSTETIYPPGRQNDPDAPTEAVTTHFLPAVYREATTTPLTATVNKGTNTINLELKRNP